MSGKGFTFLDMRFQLYFIVFHLNTVLTQVCYETYEESDEINAVSLIYEKRGVEACRYDIRPSKNVQMILNFTNISNFSQWRPRSNAKTQTTNDSVAMERLPHSQLDSGAKQCDTIGHQVAAGSKDCLPYIEIVSYNQSNCLHTSVICEANMNYQSPQVFHSVSQYLNITFKWVPGQYSRFAMSLKLENKPAICDLGQCADGSCLSDASLVCNGDTNCLDGSDETGCLVSSASASTGSLPAVEYVILPTLAIFIIFIIILVCCVRMWRCGLRDTGRAGHTFDRADFHHLHTVSSSSRDDQCTAVVYIPSNRAMNSSVSSNGSSSNRAHFNRRHFHKQAVSTNQTDPRLELPPFIPSSVDGEEGYSNNQKQLPVKQFCHQTYECFRPPNRTICGRESPPTYRSQNSYSLIGKENGKGPTRIVKNSNGDVTHYVRCYTMGNNNEYSLSRSAAVENHARRAGGNSTVPCDVNRNPRISGDPPPYSEAVAESNPAVFTRGSTGSI